MKLGFIGGTDSHIGMAARRLNRAGGPHQRGPERIKTNSGGLIAVFAMGLVAGLVASPCVGARLEIVNCPDSNARRTPFDSWLVSNAARRRALSNAAF